MVAGMAEGLHDISPPLRPVAPARGAIELLVVLDKGLAEDHLAGPLPSEVTFPHLSHIDLDGLIDDVQLVEPVDVLQSLVYDLHVESEVVIGEGGAGLEPLDDARLAMLPARDVPALGSQAKSTLGERVLQILDWNSAA